MITRKKLYFILTLFTVCVYSIVQLVDNQLRITTAQYNLVNPAYPVVGKYRIIRLPYSPENRKIFRNKNSSIGVRVTKYFYSIRGNHKKFIKFHNEIVRDYMSIAATVESIKSINTTYKTDIKTYSADEHIRYPVGTNQLNNDVKVVPNNWTCPDGNIITVGYGGQLGNRIWEYMSLYAAYQLYKEECRFYPYVPLEIKEHVELVFQKIRIPTLQDLPEVCTQQRETIVIGGHDDIPVKELEGKNAILELPKYSARYEFVSDYGFDGIRKELRFKPEYVTEVNTNLKSLKDSYYKEDDDDVVFVGMHYRGTDYVRHIKKYLHEQFEGPPTYEYYNKAMSYFQEKYEKIIFILVTIDINWINENNAGFKKDVNLVINPFESEKVKDMVLLSHCNHSIISYGSFSSTTALFAGGTTFVYDLGIPLNVKGPILAMGLASRLSNWHVIK